jgi:hypothetical protein
MVPIIGCEFRITGNFDPELITRATGILPSKIHRVGNSVSARSTLKHRADSWIISFGPIATWHLVDVLTPLLERIRPHRDVLNALKAEHHSESEFSCLIEARDEIPGCTLSAATLSDIASLGADLDIDIYFLSDSGLSE